MTVTALASPTTNSTSRPSLGDGKSHFPVSTAALEHVAATVLDVARAGGATSAETEVSQAVGQGVSVRKGEVETISYNRDKGVGVTVYVGTRRGHASTADFSDDAIRATVDKALAIARFTAEDPCAGLADPARLARTWPDLDLYHPWDLAVDDAIELGRETEAAALAVDPRITNTEGASVSRGESEFVYANSAGFSGGYRSSRHSIDCAVIDSNIEQDMIDQGFGIAVNLKDAKIPFGRSGMSLLQDFIAANPNTTLVAVASVLEAQNMIFAEPDAVVPYYSEFTTQSAEDAKSQVDDFIEIGNRSLMWTDDALVNAQKAIAVINPDIIDVNVADVGNKTFLQTLVDNGFYESIGNPVP